MFYRVYPCHDGGTDTGRAMGMGCDLQSQTVCLIYQGVRLFLREPHPRGGIMLRMYSPSRQDLDTIGAIPQATPDPQPALVGPIDGVSQSLPQTCEELHTFHWQFPGICPTAGLDEGAARGHDPRPLNDALFDGLPEIDASAAA